ncbi:MAG: transporter, partial [Gammaproteobacteria bacterium]
DATNAPRSDVSSGFLQPFLAYATAEGVTYSINSEITYNSKASSGNESTVPINFTVSKIARFGPFPFSVGGGFGWYADAPEGGPDWQLRAVFTLILPRS